MYKKMFGRNVSPACEYCENGRLTADRQTVLCNRHGVMPLKSKCRKYKYDPFKRIPPKTMPLKEYKEEDFSI